MSFWYNVATRHVETDETRGDASELLGPFATRGEAERALLTAKEHTKASDADDAAWSGDDEN